jgi:hypothetical protein
VATADDDDVVLRICRHWSKSDQLDGGAILVALTGERHIALLEFTESRLSGSSINRPFSAIAASAPCSNPHVSYSHCGSPHGASLDSQKIDGL